MSAYLLSLVTYDRGARWDNATRKKLYHWDFFLKTKGTQGLAFQLCGMPGAFYYSREEHVDLDSSASKNGNWMSVSFQ